MFVGESEMAKNVVSKKISNVHDFIVEVNRG